jgi:LPPG:FO 2-phospho-L-lactate transferase
MSDHPVATIIRTRSGELDFQEYFVRRHHADDVVGVRFSGIEAATIGDEVRRAVAAAEVIIFCPSNPIVSIGPILAVPQMRQILRAAGVPIVAVSPIVAGQALRGPADQMLLGLGYEPSPVAIAEIYKDLIDGLVIDQQDSAEAERIRALPLEVLVTDTIMRDAHDRDRLAGEVLRFAAQLRAGRGHAADRGRT